jgi:hypothetical protein
MTCGPRRTCLPALRFGRGSHVSPGVGGFYQKRSQSLRWTRRFRGSRVAGCCHCGESDAHLPPSAIGWWNALAEKSTLALPRSADPDASVDARRIILFDIGAFLPINLSPVSERLLSTAVRAPAYSDRAAAEPQKRRHSFSRSGKS